MLKAVTSFIALFGVVLSEGDSWKKEFDLVDLIKLDIKQTWDDWKLAFSREYSSTEEEYNRFGIFVESLQKIATMNSNGFETARFSLNQFSDMTPNEFREYVHGENGRCYQGEKRQLTVLDKLEKALNKNDVIKANPSSVDWTTQGVVTPVKNQGNCGSCWSFSATGAMECDYAIKHGTLTSLSEQQLVDCSGAYGNDGCNGGWYYDAWEYVHHEGGLCTESAYSYTARDGTCKASSCGTKYNDVTAGIDTKITADSDSALETAAAAGCVSVAIEADQTAFQYYSSGVLSGNCGTRIDHAVLVVGYGTESGQEYWKVKNSWGTTWGEKGYVLICRNCDKNGNKGECGINMYPYVPDY